MKYLETPNEKIAFTIASVTILIILLLCLSFGLSYLDPPPENGIAINFGTSDVGQGDIQPTQALAAAAPQPTVSNPTPVADEVTTQDDEDAPVITKEKPKKEQPKEATEKPKPAPAAPRPSKSTSDALNSILNGDSKSDGKATGGQGNDGVPGDAGDRNGGLSDGRGYGGNGGSRGTGNGNYQLSGRSVLAKPQPRYTCNEQGTVAVEITVDKSGKVISATAGVRGTTNAASCLLDQAKIAAMSTKFDSSDAAPDKQVGKIIYNFKLTE